MVRRKISGRQRDDPSRREHRFETVLGPIDFDDKGDLTVQNPIWYVWRGGEYMPLEPGLVED